MAAVVSKTLHRTRIRCMVLSVIEAYDLYLWWASEEYDHRGRIYRALV